MKHLVLVLGLCIGLLLVGCAAPAGTIKIGLEGPMTGDYALEGQGFEKAVRLLVEQTNAGGFSRSSTTRATPKSSPDVACQC